MSFTIEGHDDLAPVSSGYLLLTLDGEELHMLGVPSPMERAESHAESVSENYDELEDADGNSYTVNVCSSDQGVDWIVEVQTEHAEQDALLKPRVNVQYCNNDL